MIEVGRSFFPLRLALSGECTSRKLQIGCRSMNVQTGIRLPSPRQLGKFVSQRTECLEPIAHQSKFEADIELTICLHLEII